ncbi:hypothetical protein, conserved [Babesia ovata]|uniref:Uncharacterized protein n=1 Tax=Babesia ovata TaxID=189622 RepID=A0A2H6K7C2_9APIC|nr:uncharacterized protein BOVATA_003990 [Babesia ovata]GBE58906.1 hypothetical protein, conserved [Babesia ovata]
MVYSSLTDIPRNLKEGIDWLIALRGTDAEKNLKALGEALYKFLADKPVGKRELPALENVKLISKKFLEKPELKDMWPASELLGRFNKPMNKNFVGLAKCFNNADESDYKNVVKARRLTPKTIAEKLGKIVAGCEKLLESVKNPEQYYSSYTSEATWEASCAENPEACAVVLVGIAPMLYTGLRSLREESKVGTGVLPLSGKGKPMGKVLKAVGYKESEYRAGMTGLSIRNALKGLTLEVLDTIYDLCGFWAFY